VVSLALGVGIPALAQDEDEGAPELYRLRVVNQEEGPIEVSLNRGVVWQRVGQVVRPATASASSAPVITAVPESTVAGVTADQVLLRVPGANGALRSLRITAAGETASPSAIATDIPSRGALFRLLAPPSGSRVWLERDGLASPIPPNFAPLPGDSMLISVSAPPLGDPPSVVLENREGGEVVLTETAGVPRVIARVRQPLRGIGRYRGTERSASGSIIAWSPSHVLVSSAGWGARLSEGDEMQDERGGFVIQPAEPNLRGATHPPSQILLEALPENDVRPQLSPFFGLPVPITSGDGVEMAPTRFEIRVDGGDWEPLPDLRGPLDTPEELRASLADTLGREVEEGITHVRLLFGQLDPETAARRLRLALAVPAAAPQRGRVTVSANVGEGIAYIRILLNGRVVQLTNQAPYNWTWDTLLHANGEHLVEIEGLDESLTVISVTATRVLVEN
jgi:hypothetical protein